MSSNDKLSPNTLSFIALTNEYCQLMEHAQQSDCETLVGSLLKLLPRIYICATDLSSETSLFDSYINPSLDEETYNHLRGILSQVLAENDVYLEVFMEDMKYSDSPVATSISENLADLYQEFFNFIQAVKDVPTPVQQEIVELCYDNFRDYWGQTLCNVLRALNLVYYNHDSITN